MEATRNECIDREKLLLFNPNSDDEEFKLGEESDHDMAKALLLTESQKLELSDALKSKLDTDRYWTFVDSHTGGIFSRWRSREKDDNKKRCIEVDRIFAANRRKKIPYSCSATVSRWGLESVNKIYLWQLWHRWWYYFEQSPIQLPQNMLLPTKAIIPRNIGDSFRKRKNLSRASEDVPSTDDENVAEEDSLKEDVDVESSSDESTWSF